MLTTSLNQTIEANKSMYKKFSTAPSKLQANLHSNAQKDEIKYYNDPEKEKKGKLKWFFAAGLTLTALAGSVLTAAAYKKGDINKIISKAKNIDLKEQKKTLDKALNVMSNFTNIKDDLFDRLAKKTIGTRFQFVNTASEKMTDVYRELVRKSLRGKYDLAYQDVINNLGDNKINIEKFDDWFDKINTSILNEIHKKGNRVTENLFNKNFIDTITKSNIADSKLANVDTLIDALVDIKVPKGTDKALEDSIQCFNEIKHKSAQDLIPKLRDINIGSAPTDIITMIAPVLMLGGAVAMTEEKDEKKSIVLNLGIPLIATLGSTIYGVVNCLSGAKSLLFGFATGQIASLSAKSIDSLLTKKDEKKE